MNIFERRSKKGKREELEYVGVQLPRPLLTYLTLYSMSNGMAKSIIIRSLLKDWQINKSIDQSQEHLMNKIVRIAVSSWQAIQHSDKSNSFEKYIKGVHDELISRRLPDDIVKSIVNKVIHETKKRK